MSRLRSSLKLQAKLDWHQGCLEDTRQGRFGLSPHRFEKKRIGKMKKSAASIAMALVAAVVLSRTASAIPISVGVIDGLSGTSSSSLVAAQLNDDTFFDFSASVISTIQADTLAELLAYDVVVLGGSGNSTSEYSSATLAAVRSFLEAGHGVVTAGWYIFSVIGTTGQAESDADAITPIVNTPNNVFSNGGSLHITNTSSPITQGVSDIPVSGCCIEVGHQIDVGATLLGHTTGTVFGGGAPNAPALVSSDADGRSVYLGLLYMANVSYGNGGLRSGNADRLFEQAVAWAADAQPVSVPEPASLALFGAGLLSLAALRRRRQMNE
jgi:hypothetical protein